MLFTGEYEYTIDAKQRLAIPAEIRSRLHPERDGLAFYVTAGSNDALWLWPERTFERMAGAIEVSLLPAEEMMAFDEITFPSARRLEMDKTGRVRLPQAMLDAAGIGSKVVILGMRDHLELRDPGQWEQRKQEKLTEKTTIFHRARQALIKQPRPERDPGS